MKDINKVSPGYYHSRECNLEDFKKIINKGNILNNLRGKLFHQNQYPHSILLTYERNSHAYYRYIK